MGEETGKRKVEKADYCIGNRQESEDGIEPDDLMGIYIYIFPHPEHTFSCIKKKKLKN